MKKRTILTLTVILVCAVFGASSASAQATLTPLSGEWGYVVADEGTRWIDDDGIAHIRGMVLNWTVVGGDLDIAGDSYSIVNTNLDPATGDGDVSSFDHFDVSFGDLVGVFEGHSGGPYTGFVYSSHFVEHGSGDFAGMKFRGDAVIVYGSGLMSWAGVIHDPHGGESVDKSADDELTSWSNVKALYR